MQEKKREGRPPKSAATLAARVEGMPRFSIEMPRALLSRIDRAAKGNLRSRNAELRVLIGEALDARERNSTAPS